MPARAPGEARIKVMVKKAKNALVKWPPRPAPRRPFWPPPVPTGSPPATESLLSGIGLRLPEAPAAFGRGTPIEEEFHADGDFSRKDGTKETGIGSSLLDALDFSIITIEPNSARRWPI